MNLIFIATLACMVALVYGNGHGMCTSPFCGTPPKRKETINTKNLEYVQSKFDFTKYKYVHFKVKVCNNVHVKLMPDKAIHTDDSYEIVIEDFRNRQSSIRKNDEIKATATGRFLNCNELKTLWVSWDNNHIRVGNGNKEIMNFKDDTLYKVTGISVSHGLGPRAEWEIYNPNFYWHRPHCCYSHGNRYCVVPGMGCKFYTQKDVTRFPSKTSMKNCLHTEGLQFNKYSCTCDFAYRTPCRA